MKFVFQKSYLCSGCGKRFNKPDTEFIYKRSCICKKCYSAFNPYSKDGYFDAITGVEFMTAAFEYKGVYRSIFLNFKFKSQLAAGHMLGMAIAREMKTRDAFLDYSYIVPVPVSKYRLYERGYNQSDILAEYVSDAIGIPMLRALKRTRHTLPQSKSQHNKRMENVKDAYISQNQFNGENIILLDDIYTTGSTAYECAKTLREAGAGKICVIAGGYNLPKFTDVNVLAIY